MFRWILLFVGIYILYAWIKKKNASPSAIKKTANPRSDMAQRDIAPEVMVPCHYCQVHVPKSDAILFDGRSYCSKEHLNALDEHGWVGSAKWRSSPNYDARPENISPDLVVIHHISLPPSEFKNKDSSQYIIDFFQNRLDVSAHPYFLEIAHQKVSSHFLITRHGELIQFVSTKNKAWHAGVSSFQGREKCNDFSIGIELEGDGASAFTEEQYQALTALVKKLEAIYFNLQFAGHSDIAPERKTDPGIFFDWQKFQKETKISDRNLPFGLSSR